MTVFAEAPQHEVKLEECCFYHTIDIPGYGTVDGFYDLRGHESEYLGNVSFRGKRVLEVGPASGSLSMFMEREGAELVSIEMGPDQPPNFFWDLPAAAPPDLAATLARYSETMERLRDGYWVCHAACSSRAKVCYGSASQIPQELGRFDISVIASVLLHNRNPLQILEACARITSETIVIVELRGPGPATSPSMTFVPESNQRPWDTWWSFSPALLTRVLGTMGFPQSRVSFHQQNLGGRLVDFFTVVAGKLQRQESSQIQPQAETGTPGIALQCAADHLRMGVAETTCLEVKVRNTGRTSWLPFQPYPVLLSYHWREESGEVAIWDGIRSPLPWPIHPGDQVDLPLTVRAPEKPGVYTLELTALQEQVHWFEDVAPNLPLRIRAAIEARA